MIDLRNLPAGKHFAEIGRREYLLQVYEDGTLTLTNLNGSKVFKDLDINDEIIYFFDNNANFNVISKNIKWLEEFIGGVESCQCNDYPTPAYVVRVNNTNIKFYTIDNLKQMIKETYPDLDVDNWVKNQLVISYWSVDIKEETFYSLELRELKEGNL